MNRYNLKEFVNKQINESNSKCTMLGIGPMSVNLIRASLELANEKNFPVMYIASRNQVDDDELGGGYVNGWNAKRFVEDINSIATKIGFKGCFYICRDHGGPWQRDNERNAKLSREEAMELAKKSYAKDIEAGFDLLHIDPTKIPDCGPIAPMDSVLDMTIELIEFCEQQKEKIGKKEIFYEVGTEETNGGLTNKESFETFIKILKDRLEAKKLPLPIFIVGQTGTLVKMTNNVGYFNSDQAFALSEIAKKYGIGLKEHNCDYIPTKDLCKHPLLSVTASNVAPEYGFVETCALLDLCEVEDEALKQGFIDKSSNLYNIMLEESIACGRWKKWILKPEDQINFNDKDEAINILHLAGHYTFNNERVINARKEMYDNLEKCGINNPNQYVLDALKNNLNKYISSFNLKDSLK